MDKYGGIELRFKSNIALGKSVLLGTNLTCLAQYKFTTSDWWTSSDAGLYSLDISSEVVGGFVNIVCRSYANATLMDQSSWPTELPASILSDFRCVFANDTVSLYCDGLWVYTYVFGAIQWPDNSDIDVSVTAVVDSGTLEIEQITFSELADPREAVFVDYEATSDSAIQSIIQQRPIQIFQNSDRSVDFTYSAIKGTLAAHHISSFEETVRDNPGISSDGLVYYSDVAISISEQAAEEVGLITRLYRLSELNNGAKYAAQRMQKLALEHRKMITLIMRLDARIEVADNLLIDYVATGTQTRIQRNIVVEDISITVQNGNYSLRIQARNNI